MNKIILIALSLLSAGAMSQPVSSFKATTSIDSDFYTSAEYCKVFTNGMSSVSSIPPNFSILLDALVRSYKSNGINSIKAFDEIAKKCIENKEQISKNINIEKKAPEEQFRPWITR